MKVCISGCLGFVGRHFVMRLRDEGHEIHGCDDLSAGKPPLEWLEQPQGFKNLFYGDLRNYVLVQHVDEFDLIIHCAAVVGGRLKIDGDPLAVATDLAIDSDFFNWVARGKRKKKVVYFSSSAVYPVELQTRKTHCALAEGLVDLADPELTRFSLPDQTYGWSKFSGEYLAQYAAYKYGVDVVIYRPFGGYGGDQTMDYPFPSIIKRVIDKENPVTVWGSGEQVRDFIHIDDVVEGVLSTMDKLGPGQVLNLGTGIPTSFRDLARGACRILGHKAPVVNDPDKPEGVFYRVSDTYKMEKMFQPKIDLERGILRVARFLEGGKL
jgi:nucleoside-diphosphate-sugar epimerase